MMTEENDKPAGDAFESEEETQEIWRMPEPVFRTSEGTKYASAKNEDLHETKEQIPAPQVKSSRMPFILGGAFIIFFGVTILLAGIWFLFLRDIKPPKILTPDVEKTTPTPQPTTAPTETPATTPAPTATPTPDPGGAPVNP